MGLTMLTVCLLCSHHQVLQSNCNETAGHRDPSRELHESLGARGAQKAWMISRILIEQFSKSLSRDRRPQLTGYLELPSYLR
jgi:hypothetical protein